MARGRQRVNLIFLDSLIEPLIGLQDYDPVQCDYDFVKPDDESSYRRVIRRDLVPHFSSLDDETKALAKLALSYALTVPATCLEDRLGLHLPPFEPPHDGREFYVWLWQELFGAEDYHLADANRYKAVFDIFERDMMIVQRHRKQRDGTGRRTPDGEGP